MTTLTHENTQEVQVAAARIPDRDRLLAMLRDEGLEAHPEGELGILVPLGADAEHASDEDEVFDRVQDVVLDLAGIFVPLKHEDVIYIRPPTS